MKTLHCTTIGNDFSGMSTTMDQLSSSENWPGSQSGESNCSEPKLLTENHHSLNTSLSDHKTNSDIANRTYDLIAEEPEEESTKSESVEAISQSISKTSDTASTNYTKGVNNNNSYENNQDINSTDRRKEASPSKKIRNDLMNRSIQTSNYSEIMNLKNANSKASLNTKATMFKVIEPSFLNKLKREGEVQKTPPVYVLYPNYVLPNLDFLRDQKTKAKVLLMPQKAPHVMQTPKKRPFSCNDMEALKKRDFSHIKDWDSLNFLLPAECRQILAEVSALFYYLQN